MRELDRQRAWRESAVRALEAVGAEAPDGESDDEWLDAEPDVAESDEELAGERQPTPLPEAGSASLETLRVLGFGISRKRLEQAVRELQLPAPSACTSCAA